MRKSTRLVSALAAAVLALPFAAIPATAQSQDDPSDIKSEFYTDLEKAVRGTPSSVKVVVMLKNQPANPSSATESANLRTQDQLIAQWSADYGLEVDRQFGYLVNGFSATIPSDKLLLLQQEDAVDSVRRERVYYPTEYVGRDLHGAPAAYEDYGVDGRGTVVAIIDTGIDIDHQDMRLDDGICEVSKLEPDTANGFNCKVPFGYNYADENYTVLDTTSSQHGQHVAGIVGANGAEGDAVPDITVDGRFDGVAPNSQLLAMKVFSNDGSGGAYDADIIAAIEDSVKLGADVMNLSLGSPNGQNNPSDGTYRAIEAARAQGVQAVISAGNEGLNFSQTGETDDIFGLFDDATLGTPGSQGAAFTVASIDNQNQVVTIANWRDADGEYDLAFNPQTGELDGQWHDVVYVGLSQPADYEGGVDLTGKYALIERGGNTFTEKYENAAAAGAEGIIVFNSEAGGEEFLNMAGIEFFDGFSASIYRSAGLAMVEALDAGETVQVQFTNDVRVEELATAMTPSSFTGWGPTPTLDFEPDIAGIGGYVYSTLNNNTYGNKSGTSMAAPNIAGVSAMVMSEYKERYPDLSPEEILDRTETSLINTAIIPTNDAGVPSAPRQIGAGLGNVSHALDNWVFATVDGSPSLALREVNGPRTFTVTLENTGTEVATYTIPAQQVINETNEAWEQTTTLISGETLTASASSVTIPAGSSATVDFSLTPDTSYPHYIEGWARFESETAPDIHVPYLGFVGDWNAEPIVRDPGVEWGFDVNYSYTALLTNWAGMTLDTSMMTMLLGADQFYLSPNGDGDNDIVAPALLLDRNAAEARYSVYTADGELVRVIGEEQDLRRTTAAAVIAAGDPNADITHLASSWGFDGFIWDQTAGDYAPVPDGQYIYRVETRLGEDFDWQVTDFPFAVDAIAPEIVFGEYVDGVLTFEIIEEGSGIASYPTVVTAAGVELDVTMNDDGSFSVVVPEGTAHVTVSVVDLGFSLGVGTRVFAPSTLVVSNEEALNTAPLFPTSQVVFDDELRLSGFVSADVDSIVVNGEPGDVRNGRFTEFIALTEGLNTIVVEALNAAGDVVDSTTINPVYDSTPPTVEITNVSAEGGVPVGEDGSVTVTGVVTDEREGAALTVRVNGEDVPVAADGTFTHTFTPDPNAATFPVVASDGGNTTTVPVGIAGRTPAPVGYAFPEVTNADCSGVFLACFPSAFSADYADGIFTLRGEGAEQTSAIVFTPTSLVGADGQYVDNAPIVATQAADGTWNAPLPVVTGINDYRVEIFDLDGRAQLDRSFKLYMDVAPPTITFDEPTLFGGTLFTNDPNVTFAGSAFDDGWGYTFKINDSALIDLFNNSGFGPGSNQREFSHDVVVADGDQILIDLYDAFGNYLVNIIPVVLDQVAPEISFSVTEGQILREREPVTTTATDEHIASLGIHVVGSNGFELLENVDADTVSSAVTVEDSLINVREQVQQEEATDAVVAESETTDEVDAGEPEDQPIIDDPIADDPVDPVDPTDPVDPIDEVNAGGTETDSLQSVLEHTLDTTDLESGTYTLTASSVDLAGNVTTDAVTFTINDEPVIEGPEAIEIEVNREDLGNPEAVAALVAEHYTVIDDSDPAPALTVLALEGYLEGENTVTLVATETDGYAVEREVSVTITVAERTLTDGDVTATSTFRSDDALTATVTTSGNSTIIELTNREEFAALESVITVPGVEGSQVYVIYPNGERAPIASTWENGVLTFTGSSRATYEIEAPTSDDPTPGEPGGSDDGGDSGRPPGGSDSPLITDPDNGSDDGPGSGDTGSQGGSGKGTPGSGSGGLLAKTGAVTTPQPVIASLMLVVAGIALALVARRRSA